MSFTTPPTYFQSPPLPSRSSSSSAFHSPQLSSSRTSLDNPTSSVSVSDSQGTVTPRIGTPSTSSATATKGRSRAALRDYYKLAGPARTGSTSSVVSEDSTTTTGHGGYYSEDDGGGGGGGGSEHVVLRQLDRPDFDAEIFVGQLLEKEGLGEVLKVESALVGEIRGLDGEKKALVYDNYSKLIAATDTIRRMRTNMDPLTPTTATLSPAISYIAETASALAASLSQTTKPPTSSKDTDKRASEDEGQREKQVKTVRWVLTAPTRLRTLVAAGQAKDARRDWAEVERLLDKWGEEGVGGVEKVRRECEEALAAGEDA